MTNKELISLLSGVSMKSEVEVLLGEQRLTVLSVTRAHIPEKKDGHGQTVPARNFVQIVAQPKPGHE